MVQRIKNPNQPKSPNLKLIKTPKLYIQPNDPSLPHESPDVEIPSVISELTHNFEQYHVNRRATIHPDWIKLTCYTTRISTTVDTLRSQVKGGVTSKPVSLHTCLCCIISLGLPQIQTRSVVNELGDLIIAFQRRPKQGTELESYINDFLKSKVYAKAEQGDSISIVVTPVVKDQIAQISGDTGLTASGVATIAMYACLSQQDEAPNVHKKRWEDSFDETLAMLECKLSASKAMLGVLDGE